MNFTVLLPVYKGDSGKRLKIAIESLLSQSYLPNEILVVVDGEIGSELKAVLEEYEEKYSNLFCIKYYEKNRGLGKVLYDGVNLSKNELIARMDADDESLPDRFEKQVKCFENDKELVLLGGSIKEFETDSGVELKIRRAPVGFKDILHYSKLRNPFNHMTVMFKKSDILEVGNYMDMPLFEDYYLWVRVINSGKKVNNIADILVNASAGNEMVQKRSGLKYLKKELHFQKTLLKLRYISTIEFIRNVIVRGVPRVLPRRVLSKIYKYLLRK